MRIMKPMTPEGYEPLPSPKPPEKIQVTIQELRVVKTHEIIVPVTNTILDAIHSAHDEVIARVVEETGSILGAGHKLEQMGWKKVEEAQDE